jgi:hypothetical protein
LHPKRETDHTRKDRYVAGTAKENQQERAVKRIYTERRYGNAATPFTIVVRQRERRYFFITSACLALNVTKNVVKASAAMYDNDNDDVNGCFSDKRKKRRPYRRSVAQRTGTVVTCEQVAPNAW